VAGRIVRGAAVIDDIFLLLDVVWSLNTADTHYLSDVGTSVEIDNVESCSLKEAESMCIWIYDVKNTFMI
jgi:hypothetical protein